MAMRESKTGWFMPKNLEKYIGQILPVKYRSSWERTTMMFLDNNPNIVRWSYESIQIPYYKPMPNGIMRPAIYYPDVYVEYNDKNGVYHRELIEIKPKKQTKQSRSRNTRVKMAESYVFSVNTAKWEAAKRWCAHQGNVEFRILTETSIFER